MKNFLHKIILVDENSFDKMANRIESNGKEDTNDIGNGYPKIENDGWKWGFSRLSPARDIISNARHNKRRSKIFVKSNYIKEELQKELKRLGDLVEA